VRGPGSVIYGDYAFQGLLNVITREQGSRVDMAVGTHERRSASARLAGDAAGFRYVLQAAGFGAGDAPTPIGRAAEEDRRFYTLHVQRAALSLQINAVGRDLEGSQPVNPLSFDESSTGAELRHDRAWSEDFSTRLRLQHLSNEVITPGISFDGGHREAGAEFLWSGFANQTWLAGFEFNEASIDRATQRVQGPPNRPPPPPLVFTGLEREAHGAFVQGQFTLAERLQATLGARYDDNETVGSRFTPRASLVWRLHDNHILKAQYAEGFRSPTFFEVYTVPTQPMLDYEVNRTGEINYVYQQAQTTARVTLFRSRIDEMVFRNFGGAPGFGNVASAETEGVELEFSRHLGADWRIDSALAWVDSRHDRNPTLTATDIGAAADWFGNVGLLWTPDADSVFGLRWTHVGERSSALPADADYDRVDISWTRRNFFAPGLELQLLVQNATGAEHVYFNPSPMADLAVRYDERTAWMRLGWEW
jgi:iron complex outermembrane receptor protein